MLFERHGDVSRETTERLVLLTSLVQAWNPTIRLVSRTDITELWQRHVCDCLQLIRLVEAADGDAADIGSGAGFPGLVLAIALNRHFHLVESDLRKAAFLTEAARLTQANVTVVACRVQKAAIRTSLLTARAFASVDATLEAVFGLLAPGAVCLLPKGRAVEAELAVAAATWRMRVERFPSLTNPNATILRLSEVSRA